MRLDPRKAEAGGGWRRWHSVTDCHRAPAGLPWCRRSGLRGHGRGRSRGPGPRAPGEAAAPLGGPGSGGRLQLRHGDDSVVNLSGRSCGCCRGELARRSHSGDLPEGQKRPGVGGGVGVLRGVTRVSPGLGAAGAQPEGSRGGVIGARLTSPGGRGTSRRKTESRTSSGPSSVSAVTGRSSDGTWPEGGGDPVWVTPRVPRAGRVPGAVSPLSSAQGQRPV